MIQCFYLERNSLAVAHNVCNKIYYCSHPNSPQGAQVKPCEHCQRCSGYEPDNAELPPAAGPPIPQGTFVRTAQLVSDALLLQAVIPYVSAVVGIPRSGMIPAAALATHLHVPLGEYRDGGVQWLGHGWRSQNLQPGRRWLVIDDTLYSGNAMRIVRQHLGREHFYAVVYARPQEAVGVVDACARYYPTPHLLEWNLPNSGVMEGNVYPHDKFYFREGLAWDLDGVIVHDDVSGGVPGKPFLIAKRSPYRLIVTGRGEDVAQQTIINLISIRAKVSKIFFRPLHVPYEPRSIAEWKASVFLKHQELGMFVESDGFQARVIAARCAHSGQHVLSLADNRLITPADYANVV